MKKILQKATCFSLVICFMFVFTNMTSSIQSNSILSESNSASNDFSVFLVDESWTWTDFGGSAFAGAVGCAAGGAVVGAVCGAVGTPIAAYAGAGVGAVVGGVSGGVAGAVGYAATQAWNAVFGSSSTKSASLSYYSDVALD